MQKTIEGMHLALEGLGLHATIMRMKDAADIRVSIRQRSDHSGRDERITMNQSNHRPVEMRPSHRFWHPLSSSQVLDAGHSRVPKGDIMSSVPRPSYWNRYLPLYIPNPPSCDRMQRQTWGFEAVQSSTVISTLRKVHHFGAGLPQVEVSLVLSEGSSPFPQVGWAFLDRTESQFQNVASEEFRNHLRRACNSITRRGRGVNSSFIGANR